MLKMSPVWCALGKLFKRNHEKWWREKCWKWVWWVSVIRGNAVKFRVTLQAPISSCALFLTTVLMMIAIMLRWWRWWYFFTLSYFYWSYFHCEAILHTIRTKLLNLYTLICDIIQILFPKFESNSVQLVCE